MNLIGKGMSFQTKLLSMIGIHACIMMYSMFTEWSWWLFFLGLVSAKVFNIIGNEVALHRLWCHRSYKTQRWKEYLLHIIALPTMYGSSITYTGVHRQHHAYSDTSKDPHITSPWWRALFFIRKEKYQVETKFVKDLLKDPLHKWFHKYYFKLNILILLLSLFILGPYLTGWIFSYAVVHNFLGAGAVNVLGHRPEYGTRTFDCPDQSTNNTFLKWLTWNEGYHNHHHANPSSHTFVVHPGEFDCAAIVIEKFFMIKDA